MIIITVYNIKTQQFGYLNIIAFNSWLFYQMFVVRYRQGSVTRMIITLSQRDLTLYNINYKLACICGNRCDCIYEYDLVIQMPSLLYYINKRNNMRAYHAIMLLIIMQLHQVIIALFNSSIIDHALLSLIIRYELM